MRCSFLIVLVLASVSPVAQEETAEPTPEARPVPPVIASMRTPVRVPAGPAIADGTTIWLRMNSEAKVKKVKVGDKVDFVLSRDLYYRDTLLAKEGTPVAATVETVSTAKRVQRGSRLVIKMEGLRLLNGQILPLRGEALYKGGQGAGGDAVGRLLDPQPGCTDCELFELPILPIAGLIALFTHGENRDVKVNTAAMAFVDGEFRLDPDSLRALQPAPAGGGTGTVQIVRGNLGGALSRDIYCNGVPLAHLGSSRKLELELKPGYYRFAINRKKPAYETYLRPGSVVKLLTDANTVGELREYEVDVNTEKLSLLGKDKDRDAGTLLKEASAVDKADIYGTECTPLTEEIIVGDGRF